MLEVRKLRLTDEELLSYADESGWIKSRRIADAQFVKTMRGMLIWIKELNDTLSKSRPLTDEEADLIAHPSISFFLGVALEAMDSGMALSMLRSQDAKSHT